MKTIVIAGASGFIGEYLSAFLTLQGWKIITLGRAHADATWSNQPSVVNALNGAHAVVNLAGKSVNCRFTPANVRELISSRVDTTQAIGDAIALCENPPAIWINASGASIYRENVTQPNDEDSPIDGEGTMAEVARNWEAAFANCHTPKTKKVALRISLVLGNGGGVYPTFRLLVKSFQGGAQGKGAHMMSWIHIHDFSRLVARILQSENNPSVMNAAAPNPLRNDAFMHAFRKSLGVRFGLSAPAPLIKIGTALLGVDSELVLRGMNVVSQQAKFIGFEYDYPNLDDALKQLAGNK